ncbi:MAG: nickel-dependent lactate racemase [Halanaerobium sp.]
MDLKYGREILNLEIEEDRVLKVLKAAEKDGLENPLSEVKNSLVDPIGSESLLNLLQEKKPEDVVIVVNDVTRFTPYNYMLPPILDTLEEAGIKKEQVTFVVATGVHEPHSDQQNIEIFGEEVHNNYKFHHHLCDAEAVEIGKLSTGNILRINKIAAEADFIITTGVILPHYMAGFSGGRKSILPGVADRDAIENNHAYMVKVTAENPPLDKNPINLEMFEAAEMLGVDFIVNVVTNSSREIVKVVSGDLRAAWEAGIDISAEMYHVEIEEKADAAIVSSGGFPRDINVYQAQKALDHADHAVKEGGTIIWVAECSEGLGEERFERWMEEAEEPEDNIKRIKEKFLIGGHKAFAVSKVAAAKDVILLSSLTKEKTESMFLKKISSIEDAVKYLEEKYNGDYKTYIMPQGSLTVPTLTDH